MAKILSLGEQLALYACGMSQQDISEQVKNCILTLFVPFGQQFLRFIMQHSCHLPALDLPPLSALASIFDDCYRNQRYATFKPIELFKPYPLRTFIQSGERKGKQRQTIGLIV